MRIFWTEDTLSEFLDIYQSNTKYDKDQVLLFEHKISQEKRLMRDEKQLEELKHDLLNIKRKKFDYIIANPPYITYNECSQKVKALKEKLIRMNNVYGVNLNTVPNKIKNHSPKPNLYAYFIALANGLLKPNGAFCYIIPQTLLIQNDLDVIRYWLPSEYKINKVFIFDNNLFIQRGLKENKKIATSSLIIQANKAFVPDNQAEIVLYNDLEQIDIENTINNLKNKSKCKINFISQSILKDNFLNWNNLKWDKKDIKFCKNYLQNSEPINSVYANNEASEKKWKARFWFDKGLVFSKDKISTTPSDYQLIKLQKQYQVKYLPQWICKETIKFPKGSQGLEVFEQKYKIVWSYMNANSFYFSDKPIMIPANKVIISSNSKTEILYLFSIFNSIISWKILKLKLYLKHEQSLNLGISAIKNFVRVPIINTSQKEKTKQRIIELAEQLINLEKIILEDLINFNYSKLLPAKFNNWEIINNELILDQKYKFKIQNNSELIQSVLEKEFNKEEFTLSEIKNINIIDTNKQKEIKKQIDDLVFCLYFDEQ